MIQGINPFIIIIDKYGEVVDTVSAKSVIDDVFSILRHLDSADAESSPHLALEWKDGYFERVTDYHLTSIEARESRLKDLGFQELTEEQRANIQLGRKLI